MSKCELCNEPNDGSDSNGCSYKYIELVGGFYERSTETRSDDMPERCYDCGIKWGNIHHMACDVERCPMCGGQLLYDECDTSPKYYEELPVK